ncbi:MAG: pyrroloquinoline quinone-dependent dehydrogenase [Acidobacteriaceae bacterium]|nr:pyrroloquinoline quinone-dependent dehydrogenase [Acidobacteriaceae bacterium]
MKPRWRDVMLAVAASSLLPAQSEWPFYGYDSGGSRYSPVSQITPGNVKNLQRAWTYHTGEKPAASGPRGQRQVAFETTPLVIEGVLYLTTPANRVIALDATSGHEIWKFDPQAKSKVAIRYRAHRGVSYWPGDSHNPPRILLGTLDGRLIALSARTGLPVPGFGNEGEVDLRGGVAEGFADSVYAVTSPPAIYQDVVITGAELPESPGRGPYGDVRAWDVRSGKLVWPFHTVPRPGEPGHETWNSNGWQERTGANVWTGFTVDTQTGRIFLPIGSPAYDFYGGDRKGTNLYGDSVVALNARTGSLVWSYQLVHHDIWDYDPPAPPALISVQRGGREIPALVEVTKMGLVFILDRRNGKPVFPVEERSFPQSDVPGEASWPTQPIPVKPPPLSRSSMSAEDLTDVTPESHRFCADLFSKLQNKGRYTPYGTGLTVVFPGTLGGATWSGVSYDPNLGYVFVNTNEVGAIGQMVKEPPGSEVAWRRTSPFGEYGRFWDPNLWPCQKPPWGLLTAVNVNTGEIAWRTPLGVVEELEARGVHGTGALNIGGSIATASGLVFIGATNDQRFRAFDSRTGKELWSAIIDGSGHATPITYLGKDARQYVVIAAGGGGFFGSKPADAIVAFALPRSNQANWHKSSLHQ